MILSQDQIKNIILTNPNKSIIDKAKVHCSQLKLHVDGTNLSSAIVQIDGFEDVSLKSLRTKYAKSNKDLMARLSRPLDKIFNAKGGSIYYNLSEEQEKKARSISKDIRNGYSVKSWVENFWKPNFLKDPNGFIFMEIAAPKEAALLQQRGKSIVYPTYKSIHSVYDYHASGSMLEYVVFKLTDGEKKSFGIDSKDEAFRLVDDSNDYIVKKEGESISIYTDLTLPNLFMQVPAILNSDIPNFSQPGIMSSIFDEIIELANSFLLKNGMKLTHEFLHAYPKYWEYADDCMKCKGVGQFNGEDCPDCKGTGKKLMTKVSDVKLLVHPESKDSPTIAPNVAGYVSPDKVFHEIATSDLHLLEDLMTFTVWGASSKLKTSGASAGADTTAKTATEIMDDIKPQSDRLYPISEMAEKRHKFILDKAIQLQIAQNYQGASVSYGKRYVMEGPDEVFKKYVEARSKGAAISVLDDLLMEYYETKYANDPVKLAVQNKLMKVEPFVHYAVSEIKSFQAAENDYKAKLYYGEWLSTVSDIEVLTGDVKNLKTALDAYCLDKQLQNQSAPVV